MTPATEAAKPQAGQFLRRAARTTTRTTTRAGASRATDGDSPSWISTVSGPAPVAPAAAVWPPIDRYATWASQPAVASPTRPNAASPRTVPATAGQRRVATNQGRIRIGVSLVQAPSATRTPASPCRRCDPSSRVRYQVATSSGTR